MNRIYLVSAILSIMLIFTACNGTKAESKEQFNSTIEVISNTEEIVPDAVDESDDSTDTADTDNVSAAPEVELISDAEVEPIESEDSVATIEADTDEDIPNSVIVWLGDSLTQGSLGHENDNLANAPYVRLGYLTGTKVEGFGFYGQTAHDVFWLYRDEDHCNQSIDPNKIYIFWVGLNDWARDGGFTTDTTLVASEIDAIIGKGLDRYIVIGPTKRLELRENVDGKVAYEIINEQLASYYGEHYLNVLDVIPDNGFGPDDIHLTQESYDKVAEAVYNKLTELSYVSAQ